MRTTSLLIVAAAAAVNAGYTENNGKYVCGTANANYCLGGDIILRCDESGNGTPGRCSDNVSGDFPLGGVASCYEKPGSYGNAACEKNCVVYADTPYTLPADSCQPSYTSTSSVESSTTVYSQPTPETTKPVYYNTTVPGEPGQTTEPTEPGKYTTKCLTYTYPNPTKHGESVTKTITYTVPAYPTQNATATYNPHNPPHTYTTFVPVPSGGSPLPHHNDTCSTCHNGGYGDGGKGSPTGAESATRVPVSPASTSISVLDTVPSSGASANAVSGLLAVVGIAVAYLV